jgi:hypothetical protein
VNREADEADEPTSGQGRWADEAGDAKFAEADEAYEANETNEADEADLADEATDATETTEADEADVADKPDKANKAKVDEANEANAIDATEADKADKAKATDANKACVTMKAAAASEAEYFGINNQLGLNVVAEELDKLVMKKRDWLLLAGVFATADVLVFVIVNIVIVICRLLLDKGSSSSFTPSQNILQSLQKGRDILE